MKEKQEVKELQGAEREGQLGRKKGSCFPRRTTDWDRVTGEVCGENDVRGSGLTQFSWVEGGEVRPPGMLTDVQIWGAGARACGQSLRAVLKASSMWQWGAVESW